MNPGSIKKWPNGRTLYIPFIQILLRFPHCVVNYNMQRYVIVKLISVSLSVTQLLKRDPRDPLVYRRDDCQWVVSCTVRRVTIGIVSGVASKATVICHRSHWNEMWILWWLLIHQILKWGATGPNPDHPGGARGCVSGETRLSIRNHWPPERELWVRSHCAIEIVTIMVPFTLSNSNAVHRKKMLGYIHCNS